MKLNTETVTLKDGKKIIVSEENWDIGMERDEQQRHADGSDLADKRFQYFWVSFYPLLVSCSSGDVPDLNTTYEMLEKSPEDLDNWFASVRRVNAHWFNPLPKVTKGEYKFSDGTKIKIVYGNIPSVIMKKYDLEQEAIDKPAENERAQIFKSTFYPKLAACSLGKFPDEQTARKMPIADINGWYETVKGINPDWFSALEALSADEQKKNPKKPK